MHALVVAAFPVNLAAIPALPEFGVIGTGARLQPVLDQVLIDFLDFTVAVHATRQRVLQGIQVKPVQDLKQLELRMSFTDKVPAGDLLAHEQFSVTG